MVSRREPRKDVRVPVRIFGTDVAGKTFNENVFTVNVSRGGAMVIEVKTQLKVGEVIGIVYGKFKTRYEVRWVGATATPQQNLAGLQSVKSEEIIWDFPLPATTEDLLRARSLHARRQHPPRPPPLTPSPPPSPEGAPPAPSPPLFALGRNPPRQPGKPGLGTRLRHQPRRLFRRDAEYVERRHQGPARPLDPGQEALGRRQSCRRSPRLRRRHPIRRNQNRRPRATQTLSRRPGQRPPLAPSK